MPYRAEVNRRPPQYISDVRNKKFMGRREMSLAPIHRYIGRIIHLMRKEKGMRQSELALLAGLKQPNLSRIENGLVTPRQVTLQRIAQALSVDVQEFYSERKVQEVERKWAASLGPKHAAMMLADKLSAVPLFDITT